MLIDFFLHLKNSKLPVSIKEYLMLIEALSKGVIGQSIDDFYVLSRATLVKDERNFDKFDKAFGAYFKGVQAIQGIDLDLPLAEREAGKTIDVVVRQLRAGIASTDKAHVASFVIAYEPVWAIGAGKTATPADAGTVHTAIRQELKSLAGDRAEGIPILYGGSVNRGNAAALLAAPEVGGLLVGGASLDAEGWSAIVRT